MTSNRRPAVEDALDYLGDEDHPVAEPVAAELLAMHRVAPDRPALADPGRREVDVGDDEVATRRWFADEEPEDPGAPYDEPRTAGVADVLEAQHYAFAPEGDDGA